MTERKNAVRFGISMSRYIKDHEHVIIDHLERCQQAGDAGSPLHSKETHAIVERHLQMIGRLQHERLIHLIVTVTVALLFSLFSIAVLLVSVPPLVLLVPLILGVLLIAYLRHYFILENAVQRWYLLADKLQQIVERV